MPDQNTISTIVCIPLSSIASSQSRSLRHAFTYDLGLSVHQNLIQFLNITGLALKQQPNSTRPLSSHDLSLFYDRFDLNSISNLQEQLTPNTHLILRRKIRLPVDEPYPTTPADPISMQYKPKNTEERSQVSSVQASVYTAPPPEYDASQLKPQQFKTQRKADLPEQQIHEAMSTQLQIETLESNLGHSQPFKLAPSELNKPAPQATPLILTDPVALRREQINFLVSNIIANRDENLEDEIIKREFRQVDRRDRPNFKAQPTDDQVLTIKNQMMRTKNDSAQNSEFQPKTDGVQSHSSKKWKNYFVPDILTLIKQMKLRRMQFSSMKEIRETLMPHFDQMHMRWAKREYEEMVQRGEDTSKVALLEDVHCIMYARETQLRCQKPGCPFKIFISKVECDEGVKYMFTGKINGERHAYPLH